MIQNFFLPGDKWIYYQVFIGVQNSNSFLCEYLYETIRILKEENKIVKWFFIRYNQPEFHLRIRFELRDTESLNHVIYSMNDCLSKPFCKEAVWTVKLDSYDREIERYGINTILLAEEIFYWDSEHVISILKRGELPIVSSEWQYAINTIILYLDLFFTDMTSKINFVKKSRNAYAKEFVLDKKLKIQMAKKYRAYRGMMEKGFFKNEKTDSEVFLTQKLMDYRSQIVDEDMKEKVLSSLIHMSLNRLFRNKNREQEFLCYDFLLQDLKSKIVRNKYTSLP